MHLSRLSNTCTLKVLLLTRQHLCKRFVTLPIVSLELRHIDHKLHADWYYSDVVLFQDEHITKIFKAPVKTNQYILTEDVKQFLET